MCSDCGVDEPVCNYCGDQCFGDCADPDTCGTCWAWKYFDYDLDVGGETLDDCLADHCDCECHEEFYVETGIRFEAGVLKDLETHGPPYDRKGVFPFLSLPGEIRDKIYAYTMLQEGKRRIRGCRYHRGAIHTALLQTCRQVNIEARHLPLTINRLHFQGPLSALHFFGYMLAPTVSGFVKAVHIEQHIAGSHDQAWYLLVKEMAKMNISHLGLTVSGGFSKEMIVDQPCFAARFAPLMKLRSIELEIGSAFVDSESLKQCLEHLKSKLVTGYEPADQVCRKAKRGAISDTEQVQHGKKSAKMAKNIKPSSKDTRRSTRSNAAKILAKQAAKAELQATLMMKYTKLNDYAMSLNMSLVSIRLDEARKAIEETDQQKFEALACSIWGTLEEHYNTIAAGRNDLLIPNFATPDASQSAASMYRE